MTEDENNKELGIFDDLAGKVAAVIAVGLAIGAFVTIIVKIFHS